MDNIYGGIQWILNDCEDGERALREWWHSGWDEDFLAGAFPYIYDQAMRLGLLPMDDEILEAVIAALG